MTLKTKFIIPPSVHCIIQLLSLSTHEVSPIASTLFTCLFLSSHLSKAATVHFNDASLTQWDNGSGVDGTWDPGATTGTATIDVNGTAVTVGVESRNIGTFNTTANHLNVINASSTGIGSFYEGFVFQGEPISALNGGNTANDFQNYWRLDISFSEAIKIDQFVLTDIDSQGRYIDLFYVEGWNDSNAAFGAYGTGTTANYLFNATTDLTIVDRFDRDHVRTITNNDAQGSSASASGATVADHQLGVNFQGTTLADSGINKLSIYYSNDDFTTAPGSTQTGGLLGESFSIRPIPEPSSVIMFLLGSVSLLSIRRRSKSS